MNAALRPPLAGEATVRCDRRDALVLSSDDALLIELGPLLGDRYRVHTVDTPERIGGQVEVVRWIGLVDADTLPVAHGAVSRLEAQYPHCPLIVITARPEAWRGSIARGTVLRAISRDELATAGRLEEALLSAEARLRPPTLDTLQTGAVQTEAPPVIPDRFAWASHRRSSFRAGAAVLLLVLGANGAWLYHRYGPVPQAGGPSVDVRPARPAAAASTLPLAASPPASVTAASSSALPGAHVTGTPPLRPQSVLELLSAARVAFRDQRLLPQQLDGALDGNSALELYIQVLRQDPRNDEALEGVRRLLVVGRTRISTDVASGHLDDASRMLDAFRAAGLPPADLQPLARTISAAQPKWLAQRAAQSIAGGDFKTADALLAQAFSSGVDAATVKDLRSQEAAKKLDLQLRVMAAQVQTALQGGTPLQPALDTARARVAAMRSLDRYHPLTLQAEQSLQDALIQAAEQATRSAHFDIADHDLNAAGELGSSALLTAARRYLQVAREAASHHTPVAAASIPRVADAPMRTLALTAPAPAEQASSSPPYIAAHPTRALAVSYPYRAQGKEGTVVVEFTLSANGKASHVSIVQSDAGGIFDSEAINAVRHGRYSTRELVNRQPVRARIKLHFTPTEG